MKNPAYLGEVYAKTLQLEEGLETNNIADEAVTPEKMGGARIAVLHETFSLDDFTAVGAVGTATFSSQIPVGAVVTRSLITDVTGFIGDTSAVVTLGDGTDDDRYNTGTPSVFTTVANVDAGVPSGTVYHASAIAPEVIVTSASDFGDVTDGALTVSIFYYIAE